jgi:hypothetical protein
MTKPPRTGDVVEVAWLDSESIDIGWSAVSDYRKAGNRPQSYRTAGYFIEEGKQAVLIALSMSVVNRTLSHVMAIPVVAVQKMTVLGRANARVRKALR